MNSKLQKRLTSVGRVVSSRFDVDVVFHANDCHTDGKKITLPAVPDDLPEDLARVMQGHLDHEVAHLVHTDWMHLKMVDDISTNMWAQGMEDVRIEHRQRDMWKGSGKNLDFSRRWFMREKVIPEWSSLDRERQIWYAAFLLGYGDQELLSELPDQPLVEALEPLRDALQMAQTLPTTGHAIALSVRIMEALGLDPDRNAAQKGCPNLDELLDQIDQQAGSMPQMGSMPQSQDQKPAQGQGQPQGSTTGKDEGQGQGDEEKDAEGSSKGDSTTAKNLSQSDDKHEYDQDPNATEQGESQASPPSLSQALSDAVKEYKHYRAPDQGFRYIPFSTAEDDIKVAPAGCKKWFRRATQDCRKDTGIMARHLRMALAGIKKSRVLRGQSWGKLSPQDLPRFLVRQDPRVFKRKTRKQTINSRIGLLIDVSGSMTGSKLEAARQATVSLGEFAHSVKLPFAVWAHSTANYYQTTGRYTRASKEEQQSHHRWGDLLFHTYKDFNEDWRRVGSRLSNLQAEAHTYDGEAVLRAAKALIESRTSPDERLILFVLSDGRPEQRVKHLQPQHQRHLKEVVEKVTKAGIEVIAIGIQTDAVKEYYPNYIVLRNPRDLAKTQLAVLKDLLLKKK